MTAEFDKDYLPAWCENCDKQGIYFVDNFDKTYHVIHKKCGYEILSTHCDDCTMGFAIPNQPGNRPQTWTCDGCGKVYNMDMSIYEQPIDLHIESELPEEVRSRIHPKDNVLQRIALVLVFAIIMAIRLFLRSK